MNLNRIKDSEKRCDINLNQGRRKSDSNERFNIHFGQTQKKHKDNGIRADIQISTLNNTLKNMIKTGRESSMTIEMALTGFYQEISNSIKRM